MKRKKKYYKLWLHVEEIKTDADGHDLDYETLNDEFLPVDLGKCQNKKEVRTALDAYEQFERGIALLTSVLVDSCMESDYDKQIYEYLKGISRLPHGYKPY